MKDENTSTNIDIKDIISEKPSNLTITQLKKDINFFTKDLNFDSSEERIMFLCESIFR